MKTKILFVVALVAFAVLMAAASTLWFAAVMDFHGIKP